MLRILSLAALLALPPAAARADQAPPCLPMPFGCYLERPGATAVLIYHRGYLTEALPGERFVRGGGFIPPKLLPVSAAQAVRQYELDSVAAALNASLVVTGSYYTGIDAAGLAQGRRVFIAAHSGGVVGLAKTLGTVDSLDGLALLDCFYGEDSGALASVGARVGQLLAASKTAACGGFYTPHNASRLRRVFGPALGAQAGRCRFDTRAAGEHNSAVAGELVRALRSPLFVGKSSLDGVLGRASTGSDAFDARFDAATQALQRAMGEGSR